MSDQMKAFQREIGANPDGAFGPATMKAAIARFGWTKAQAAHFFGNTAHETGDYSVFSENLNYSAEGLMRTWPSRFPSIPSTQGYARNPMAIANKVYGSRMGNGPESSGDGWKFRGRGAIQTTGKLNYQDVAKGLSRPDIMQNPDLLAGELAMDSAIYFFTKNRIWAMCADTSDATISKVRHVLNGGFIGLPDVTVRVKKYAGWVA